MFLVVIIMRQKKLILDHLQSWVRLGKMYGSSKAGVVVMKWEE